MKNISIIKRNLIVALVAVMTVTSIGVYKVGAAGRVELDKTVTVTAKVSSNDTSTFANKFKGTVEIDLYKIASLDETGKATLLEAYANSGIDLSVLDNNPSVDTVKSKIVTPALAAVQDREADAVITFDRSDESKVSNSASVGIEGGAGIYLYNPKDVSDGRYMYSFLSYILYAPTSDYIQAGVGDDTWNYESIFVLKAEETELFGKLEIVKTLDTFNTSLGKASFVYKVNAIRDEEVVFDNVYSIDFNSSGTRSRVIEDIPADSIVTVTEVYTGASYQIMGDIAKDTPVFANETSTVNFENDYDGRLISGGVSAENVFEEEDGIIYWLDSNGERVAQ